MVWWWLAAQSTISHCSTFGATNSHSNITNANSKPHNGSPYAIATIAYFSSSGTTKSNSVTDNPNTNSHKRSTNTKSILACKVPEDDHLP